MKIQNILQECKDNGLERLIKNVPTEIQNHMYIGNVVMLKDRKKPKYAYNTTKEFFYGYTENEDDNDGPVFHHPLIYTKRHYTPIFHKEYKGEYPMLWYNSGEDEYHPYQATEYINKERMKEIGMTNKEYDANEKLYNDEYEKYNLHWRWKRFDTDDDIKEFCADHNLKKDKLSMKEFSKDGKKLGWLVAVPVERWDSKDYTTPIKPPYIIVETMFAGHKKSKRMQVVVDICKDLGIDSFTQIAFGSFRYNNTIWNEPNTNPFW